MTTIQKGNNSSNDGNHSIFRLDMHASLIYFCAVIFKNNDYGKEKANY